MLGVNKNINKWNIAALLTTIVLFIITIYMIIIVPKKYEIYQNNYISIIRDEVNNALEEENKADTIIRLRNSYDFDVIVLSKDKLMYTSNGLYDFNYATEIVNTGFIHQEVYKQDEYSVWLTIYSMDVEGFVYKILKEIALLFVLQLICIILTVAVLLKKAIKPLNDLSDIVRNLKNETQAVDVAAMDEKIDEINMELIKVSNELKLKLYSNKQARQEYHRRYNLQNNLLYEQKKYLSSVVHDVKSTFLAIKFSTECLKESSDLKKNDVDIQVLNSIENSSVKALELITESLDNVINDSHTIYMTKTNIDVKKLVIEYFELNTILLYERKLSVDVTGDDQEISANLIKVGQLINNILSNMIKNATEGSTLKIEICEKKCTFINEVDEEVNRNKTLYNNHYGMRIINDILEGTTISYHFTIEDGVATGMLYEVIDNVE